MKIPDMHPYSIQNVVMTDVDSGILWDLYPWLPNCWFYEPEHANGRLTIRSLMEE